jgi:hypothetical protein
MFDSNVKQVSEPFPSNEGRYETKYPGFAERMEWMFQNLFLLMKVATRLKILAIVEQGLQLISRFRTFSF